MNPNISGRGGFEKRYYVGNLSALLLLLIVTGIFARNDWFPSTDPLTGARKSWFGRVVDAGDRSAAGPVPTPALTLSKEHLYLGGELIAVEDAGANRVGPADLAVWRPSTGTWWVMGGAGDSQPATQAWGLSSDRPVPGDYDGDRKTDFSIFRPASGEWYVLQSSDNTWAPVTPWGLSSDRCVPADYDGDGKTDRAVWRGSDGTWYIVRSSDQQTVHRVFGAPGDLPLPGDYDGDGRADVSVWRDSNRTVYSLNSSDGSARTATIAMPAGGSRSWSAASADFDGDGVSDHGLFDRNSATWYIKRSSDHQSIAIQWGAPGDIPVPNDYEGDGKCDIAVWRPTDNPAGTIGTWFIRQSAWGDTLRQERWGIAGDIPVPALYRR